MRRQNGLKQGLFQKVPLLSCEQRVKIVTKFGLMRPIDPELPKK
jgi:hypothetical protein